MPLKITLICFSLFIAGIVVISQFYDKNEKGNLNEHHDDHFDRVMNHQEHDHHEDVVHLTFDQINSLGIEITPAAPGYVNMTVSSRGKIVLHPDHLAHIIPKVPGVAKEVFKNIGNAVKENERLAVLESQDIADLKAAYLASLSKLKLTASALDREEMLYREKISAGQDFLNAKNMHEEAIISLELAKQKLRALGLNSEEISLLDHHAEQDLRLYNIRSPIDGIVIFRHITKGEYIENKETIYEVANLNTVWVDIGIFPQDLHLIKEGQIVDIVLPGQNLHTAAKLIYVSPLVEEETITAKAIAEIDNSKGNWRPGVFVQVNIATESNKFPVVVESDRPEPNS